MLENKRQPLLSFKSFLVRVLRSLAVTAALIGSSLFLGAWGYHYFEGLSWLDAVLNASMILSGMGPVNELHTVHGKLFASGYAIFSGVLFIGASGLLLGPFLHRLMHSFHLDEE